MISLLRCIVVVNGVWRGLVRLQMSLAVSSVFTNNERSSTNIVAFHSYLSLSGSGGSF